VIRFFVDSSHIRSGQILFDSADSHHIHTVLKMRPGDRCAALDNTGALYHATLQEVVKSRCVAKIRRTEMPQTEPGVKIVIAQALPRTLDKLEWVLQHGVEAGASEFLIFSSSRSRPEASRFERKLDRWREIVKTAAEQSERARLPEVRGIVSFSEMLRESAQYDKALLAYEREKSVSLASSLEGAPKTIIAIIGPESGFDDDEIAEAKRCGVTLVSLGPRILRTETAGLVMTAQIIYALDQP
jgi:16S rRNA (uracil1498-N3)-methyltransferase